MGRRDVEDPGHLVFEYIQHMAAVIDAALPAPGPLRITQRAQVAGAGRVDEVCELWDSTGALVGQATQLAAIRFDDESALTPPPAR